MPISELENNLNLTKCKGLFVPSLRKVQHEVHPDLSVQDEALEYVEGLIIQLLSHLCANQPHSVTDVEERVTKTFPNPIDKWANSEAQIAIEKGKKKKPLALPVDKVHPLIKLAGNYVKNIRHEIITCQDIKVALFADKVLMDMFHPPDDVETQVEEETFASQTILSYDEVIRSMLIDEAKYVRSLNMIIKVFKAPFVKAKDLFTETDIATMFSNIQEIYDFSVTFMGLLEAAIDSADEGKPAAIGECFEEMAEGAEFEVYETYAREQTAMASKLYRHLGIGGKLNELLARPSVADYFKTIEAGFKETVQYCLPKLLMTPIYHCLRYFELMKLLLRTSPDDDDKESLEQAQSALKSLQATMERIVSSGTLAGTIRENPERLSRSAKRRSWANKSNTAVLSELQKNIDGWEGRDITQSCTELLKEGSVGKVHPNGKISLDLSILKLHLQNTRHALTGPSPEYRLKGKYVMRKVEVSDLEDTHDVKNAFEIGYRDQPKSVFVCKNEGEKSEWMSVLMTLYMQSTLDRMLDRILVEEEKAIPLKLPSPSDYCFSEEDREDNIVFEEGQGNLGGAPVIKGGTLVKLMERLTHHKYADPSFVRTFLTTYRSFCKPKELLEYLITRFDIPEPPPSDQDKEAMERGESVVREDLKRFRKEYAQPVQLRVLNVLRHWVDNHYYDFERDEDLLLMLNNFLEGVRGKAMKRWVYSINKVVARRRDPSSSVPEITFEKEPPAIEWHIAGAQSSIQEFSILTLHPIEIARQLTLMESELYRAVRPSELVGSVWTKEDIKHMTSPNLLKMIHHTNKITMWFEKSLLEMANFEERVAVLTRIVDILVVFQELNNFNGILEIVSALNSSPVFRLTHTFAELGKSAKRSQMLEEARELGKASDHYKKYTEKLRSINPPCVPFFGMYLTNILKTEEGNPDFLPNYPEGIINFSKRRKVAEITGEIQQYQNQPYCLKVEPIIQDYLDKLDPFEGRTGKEMDDYLYELSLSVEPRNGKQPTKSPRTLEFKLNSPGTRPAFMLNRMSLGQTSLRRNTSSTFIADGTTDFNLPRTPLSPGNFSQISDSSSFTEIPPESPGGAYESEPDYENIENFPEKDSEESLAGPPPDLPPRRPTTKKPRSVSLNEDRSNSSQQIRRIRSERHFTSLSELPELEFGDLKAPVIPPKTPTLLKGVTSSAFDDEEEEAPPLPPRLPTVGSVRGRPPLLPRMPIPPSSPMRPPMPLPTFPPDEPETAIQGNNAPPKLPPKTRRS